MSIMIIIIVYFMTDVYVWATRFYFVSSLNKLRKECLVSIMKSIISSLFISILYKTFIYLINYERITWHKGFKNILNNIFFSMIINFKHITWRVIINHFLPQIRQDKTLCIGLKASVRKIKHFPWTAFITSILDRSLARLMIFSDDLMI